MPFNSPKPRPELKSEEESLHGSARLRAEEANFEPYDPVRWETAAEETTVDEAPNKEAGAPNPPDDVEEGASGIPKPAAVVLTSESDFVRALRDSRVGSKPYYKKGDILRVINKTSRRNLNGELGSTCMMILPGLRYMFTSRSTFRAAPSQTSRGICRSVCGGLRASRPGSRGCSGERGLY